MELPLILSPKSTKALQRTVGEALLGTNGMFDGLVQGATQALNSVKKLFEVPMAQKYREEQETLNALVFQIQGDFVIFKGEKYYIRSFKQVRKTECHA